MITAIDTNILLDILVPNEEFYEASADALQDSAAEGSLVISDIVYAELCIHFETRQECDAFLESNDIRTQSLTREVHFLASRAWRTYRRQGGQRTRILADFSSGLTPGRRRRVCSRATEVSTTTCFRRLRFMTRPRARNARSIRRPAAFRRSDPGVCSAQKCEDSPTVRSPAALSSRGTTSPEQLWQLRSVLHWPFRRVAVRFRPCAPRVSRMRFQKASRERTVSSGVRVVRFFPLEEHDVSSDNWGVTNFKASTSSVRPLSVRPCSQSRSVPMGIS